MWHAIAVMLAAAIGGFWNIFPTTGTGAAANAQALLIGLPAPYLNWIVGALSIFGLFIDMNVLWACIACALLWKLGFLFLRLWRIVLELVPFAG